MWISSGVMVGDDGRVWCQGGSKSSASPRPGAKRRYDSIHEAWLVAFTEFHRHGGILTPYQCHGHVNERTVVNIRPHPNPWSFRPYYVKKVPHYGLKRVVCEGWHLAKRVYALPPGRITE